MARKKAAGPTVLQDRILSHMKNGFKLWYIFETGYRLRGHGVFKGEDRSDGAVGMMDMHVSEATINSMLIKELIKKVRYHMGHTEYGLC